MAGMEKLKLLVQIIERDLQLVSHQLNSALNSLGLADQKADWIAASANLVSIQKTFSILASKQFMNVEKDAISRMALNVGLEILDEGLNGTTASLSL